MGDVFQEASGSFVNWFKNTQPLFSHKIQLADLRPQGKGRGIDLAEDEEIFSVSRSRILSTENSDLAKDGRGQDLLATLDDQWLSLIAAMIFEYLRGPNSPWKPYFDVLPSSFNTLMFWTNDELAELQASSVKDKIGRVSANDMFNQSLIPAIRAASDLFTGASSLSDNDLLALAHRMGSTIMAYAFDIEKNPSTQAQDEDGYVSDEEQDFLPKGMVPMADMLNADATRNNARLFYETDTVTMRTLVPVQAGEELFNDYGPLPRTDLLRRYGYVTDNYSQYDVVEIPFDLVVDVVKASKSPKHAADMVDEYYLGLVTGALSVHGFYEDAYDISAHSHAEDDEDEDEPDTINSPLFPPGLQMLLYRLLVDNSPTPAPTKYAKRPSALSAPEQSAIRTAYIEVLRARQAQYATTIEQDRRMLHDLSPEQAQSRKGMALQVRLGEKLVLQKALEYTLSLSANANSTTTARGSKRARTNGH